jgi:hypothetical protein
MIMSSVGLDRNVLFSRKVVKNRQLQRRCLNGRRSINHELEGTITPGHDDQGEREDNDDQGGIGDGEGKLPGKDGGYISDVMRKGTGGLIHRNRGQPSNRRKPDELKKGVLDLYREQYWDFGPTLAAKKLW